MPPYKMANAPEDVVKILYNLLPDCRAASFTCKYWYNAYVTTNDHLFWSRPESRAIYAAPKMIPGIFGDLFKLAFAGNVACVEKCFGLAHHYGVRFNLEEPENEDPTIRWYGESISQSCAIVDLYDQIAHESVRGGHWQILAWIALDPVLTDDEKRHIILRALAAYGTPAMLSKYNPNIHNMLNYIGTAIEHKNTNVVEYCIFYARDDLANIDHALSFAVESGSLFAAKMLKKHFKIYPHHIKYAWASNDPAIIRELAAESAPISIQTQNQLIDAGKFVTLLTMGKPESVEQLWRNISDTTSVRTPQHVLTGCTNDQLLALIPIRTNNYLKNLLYCEIIRRNNSSLLQHISHDIPKINPEDALLDASMETLRALMAAGAPKFMMQCLLSHNISQTTIEFAAENGWSITPTPVFSYSRSDIEYILGRFPGLLADPKYEKMHARLFSSVIKLPNCHKYIPITRESLYKVIMNGRMDVAAYIANLL